MDYFSVIHPVNLAILKEFFHESKLGHIFGNIFGKQNLQYILKLLSFDLKYRANLMFTRKLAYKTKTLIF